MPVRKVVGNLLRDARNSVKDWVRADQENAGLAERVAALEVERGASSGDAQLVERLDKLEKKLSMTMGAVQAATAEITRLKGEVEEARRRADQAVQRAESALATAESAAES